MSIQRRLVKFDQKTCIFVCSLSPSIIIMHVPISELHAQCSDAYTSCGISLNSQRFLQFHPTVMLVVYVNSCFIIIRQNFFSVPFSSRIS